MFRSATGQQTSAESQRVAVAIGLAACVAVLALVSVYLSEPWAAALVCLLMGLFAQSVGAFLYRAFLFVKTLLVR